MFGLYIHFPFCRSRCVYCDFYSQTNETLKERYIATLCKELYQRREEGEGGLSTIYLGGGTPSLFSVNQLSQVFETIEQLFGLGHCEEITIEANPDDLNNEYLGALRSTPINRLSIGVQSFNDIDLKRINRRHTAKQAIKAIENAYQQGFQNLSMDLILGLPQQSLQGWKANLVQALALPITHLSAYQLTVEEGTPLYQSVQKGEIKEVEEEEMIEMFHLLQEETQKKGMEQYEISNFSFPSFHSKHNSSYWNGTPYMGIGPAAHSYKKGVRRYNEPDLHAYLTALEAGNPPPMEQENLSFQEEYNDFLLTRLRTARGIEMEEVESLFGNEQKNQLLKDAQEMIHQNLLNFDGRRMTLFPQGILLADMVIRQLFRVEEE